MPFFLGETMEEKDKTRKDYQIWIDEHVPQNKRQCSSGMTFSGRYVEREEVMD